MRDRRAIGLMSYLLTTIIVFLTFMPGLTVSAEPDNQSSYDEEVKSLDDDFTFKDRGLIKELIVNRKIALDELNTEFPEFIDVVYSDGTVREMGISWESTEDYENTDRYYYVFYPRLSGEASHPITPETPYIIVWYNPDWKQDDIEILKSLRGSSNEEKVYFYLTETMNLNVAAACGVLANISAESGFRPNALGDNGTSYGICQWHNSRWDNLKTFCNNNGFDWTSLEGQLHFLQYELETSYGGILSSLRNVSNTAQGAYDAAYTWCYNFEIPANRASVSVSRGNVARNTYWSRYSGGAVVPDNYFSSLSATNITETNAQLNATLSGLTYVNSCGFYLSTNPNMSNSRQHNETVNGNVENIWYDLNSECGITLQQGTTYYWQMYVVMNGTEYKSSVQNFKTLGNISKFSALSTTNITGANAQVNATLSELTYVNSCGFYLSTSSNMSNSRQHNETVNGNVENIWYDLNSECGITLQQGTTYYWQMYVVMNGTEYKSNVQSFKTVTKDVPLTGFTLNTTNLSILKGKTATLTVTAYTPSDTTSDKSATWKSSNTSVATVSGQGVVTAKSVGIATITCTVAGVYRTCQVTVKATVDDTFSDVGNTWYTEAVQYVYDNGIMTGKSTTQFAPNATLSRAEFATTLYNCAGKPAVSYYAQFSDVKSGQWYTNPIIWAYNNNLVSGYPNGKFGVSDKITREQLALILYQYAKSKNYSTASRSNVLNNYVDKNRVSSWAKESMEWAVTQGIISGKGDASSLRLAPQGNATRAECAMMLMKLLKSK